MSPSSTRAAHRPRPVPRRDDHDPDGPPATECVAGTDDSARGARGDRRAPRAAQPTPRSPRSSTRGFKTGAGNRSPARAWLAVFRPRAQESSAAVAGARWLTTNEIAAKLGVSDDTVKVWRGKGRLQAQRCNDKDEWLYRRSTSNRSSPARSPLRRPPPVTPNQCRRCSMKRLPLRSTCWPACTAAGGCG